MTTVDSFETGYCTTKRAAQLLGVSVTMVQKYCEIGLLKMYKSIGGHRRISVESLSEYIVNRDYDAEFKDEGRRKLKVMLLEDDPQVVDSLESFCAKSNLKIQCFKSISVFDGIIKILDVNPELIFVSLDSAEFDGYKFVKSIEKYPRLKNTMVILTSNKYHNLSDYTSGLNGRVAFVQKPIPDEWLDGYFIAFRIQKYLSAYSGSVKYGGGKMVKAAKSSVI